MVTVATPRIGPLDAGRKMTLAEFLEAEEEPGYRYELAKGVMEVTYVPDEPHALIVCLLLEAIVAYRKDHPGVVYRWGGASEFRLWLPGMISGRNPDVAVVLHNAPRDEHGWRIPGLVMEVVSEGDDARERDYVTKREEYLAYGLFEYWIVDPFEQRVTVLTRRGDVWHEQIFTGERAAEGLVLPGLRVRLSEIWAAAAEAGEVRGTPE